MKGQFSEPSKYPSPPSPHLLLVHLSLESSSLPLIGTEEEVCPACCYLIPSIEESFLQVSIFIVMG
jgi:hypothetical protein